MPEVLSLILHHPQDSRFFSSTFLVCPDVPRCQYDSSDINHNQGEREEAVAVTSTSEPSLKKSVPHTLNLFPGNPGDVCVSLLYHHPVHLDINWPVLAPVHR